MEQLIRTGTETRQWCTGVNPPGRGRSRGHKGTVDKGDASGWSSRWSYGAFRTLPSHLRVPTMSRSWPSGSRLGTISSSPFLLHLGKLPL